MRRYGSLLLILVLATASLLAAAAYSSATITNAAEVTIANTTNGLLALWPGSDPDHTAYVQDGKLCIDFDRGYTGGWRQPQGLQPWSIYTWNDLFGLTNLSYNTVAFRVDLLNEDGTAVTRTDVKITITCDGVVFVNENSNTSNVWTEGTYFNKLIDVKVEVSKDAALTYPSPIKFLFRVVANAV